MPITITRIETTPNPCARKLIVDPAPGSIRSYFDAQAAADDPIASALFVIPQITNVLIHTQFISVCFATGTNWKPLSKAIERALLQIP